MTKPVAGIPLIIEASLNGQTQKSKNPNVPYTDEEIVDAPAALEGLTEMDAVIAYLQGLGASFDPDAQPDAGHGGHGGGK